MVPVCALVFASLCISQGDLEITDTWSMIVMKDHGFSTEAVKRRGVEIDAMESDEYVFANGLFLDRACADSWCVSYIRHCKTTSCKFEVGSSVRENALRGEVILGANFEIRARTQAQLRSIMKTLVIALADRDGAPHAYMPLTRLDRESTPKAGGQCSRIVWFEGCDRPSRPGLPRPEHL